jgi:hypothetical protein
MRILYYMGFRAGTAERGHCVRTAKLSDPAALDFPFLVGSPPETGYSETGEVPAAGPGRSKGGAR